MALNKKDRNWEPQNARNMRNYLKNPNAVTGALFRQSEGKGLTDAQRNSLRKLAGGDQMVTNEYVKGDPNVMSGEDEALLRQATAKYHEKQKAKANSPMAKMKGAMRGVGSIEGRPPQQGNPRRPNQPGLHRPGDDRFSQNPGRPTWGAGSGVQPGSVPKGPPMPGGGRGYGRPGWGKKNKGREGGHFNPSWPGKNQGR